MASKPVYEIVSPIGEEAGGALESVKFAPAPPLADLNGKRIGLVWTVFTNGDVLLEAFRELLGKRYPGLSFVNMAPGRNAAWGGYPDRTLPEFAREQGIDAAIVTAGC
jgi:hypothetical protein